MTSLKTLLALKPQVLYPAHGPHIPTPQQCAAHITEYINHRQEREDQIVSLISSIASPGALVRLLREHKEEREKENAAKVKYKAEFMSGKPYKPKDKSKDTKDRKGDEAAEKEEEAKDPFEAFEGDERAIPIPLLCRLLYKTDDEKVIFAAGKSALAHLQKLEKEGRVGKVTIVMPKIVDGVAGEREVQEGWQVKEKEGE
jgi:hypothetical protein